MVSFCRSTPYQSILNLRLSALMILFYSHMIIMVSCASDRQQDDGKVCHNNKNYFHIVDQNELNEVRNSKETTEVKDLILDENSLLDFPIQEDGHIKWINIAESISQNHCKKFGILLLGLQRISDVNSILERNPDVACEMILLKWLNMEGANYEPITFRTLINVIHKLGKSLEMVSYNELANKIKIAAEMYQMIDMDYIPGSLRKYSSQISERYQKDTVIDSSQFIPKMLNRNISFVDLELKEDNNNNLILDDLLHDIQDGMRILFTGRPGVGKTTITRYLSKHMHKFKLHFVLTIKLHLGALVGQINDLDTLLKNQIDFFLSVDIAHISSFVQRTSGKGICFLLDGYDEYVPTRHGSYIDGLIKGIELTKSVVIVTSRPSTMTDIKYLFQRKIEIIGFTENRINTYLRQLQLSDVQNEAIYRYLDNHPNVKQMCYLPLHLSMLVYMIITTDNSTLTLNTETKLYYNFLALTIKHRHERAVESFKECFSDPDTKTDLCDILKSISKSAFDGLEDKTQVFTSSSLTGLSRIANVSAEIEALSLFKIETFYDGGGSRFCKFWYLHPTFQEFLAAFHLTTLPKEIQFSYLGYSKYSWMHQTYVYFFGLIGSMPKYDNETIMIMFIRFVKEYIYHSKSSYYHLIDSTSELKHYGRFLSSWLSFGYSHNYNILYHDLYTIKCAYEAGHDSQWIPYLKAVSQSNSLYIDVEIYDGYNCWYIGYILAQAPVHVLKLRSISCSQITLCLLFVTKYLKNDARFSGYANVTKLVIVKIDALVTVGENCSSDNLEVIKLLSVLFQKSLTCLKLIITFDTVAVLHLIEILKSFNVLHSLALMTDVNIDIKEEHFEKFRNLNTLRHLQLILENDDFFSIKKVNASYATGLLGGLKYLSNLETLTLCLGIIAGYNVHDHELLQRIHKINIKSLTLNLYLLDYTHPVTVKKLAKKLSSLRLLLINVSLHIESQFFYHEHTHDAMIELADVLGNFTELQELRLYFGIKTVTDVVAIFYDKLKHLHNLHTLALKSVDLHYDKLIVLFSSLTNLRNLDLRGTNRLLTGRRQPDKIKLLNALKNLKQLQKLKLSWIEMGDDDMEPLTEALKEMNNLHTLDLSHNSIGDDGIKLLAELFDSPQQYLCTVEVLRLHSNTYSEVGTKILAEKFKKLLHFHTIEVVGDYELNAEISFLKYQRKVNRTSVISPQQTSPLSMAEMVIFVCKQFHPYNYSIISLILGIIVLLGVSLFFKSKVSKKFIQSTELSRALSCSTFSVSDAWHLKRLDSIGLNGTGTVVAILDTAIYQNFPSFTGKKILNITINESFPSFTGEEILVIDCLPHVPAASNEHGTLCSAIAVGSQCDTISGVVPRGVAPDARLIVYRIAEGDNYFPIEATLGALDDIQNRIKSSIQIDVVSISYHYDVNDHQLKVFQEKIKILTEMGITFVAAAGNRGNYQALACIPARFDSVISVGALNKNGKRSSLTPQVKIDVYAPGDDLKFPTTDNIFWGTSYATPAVAGLVLLLKQWANHVGSPAKEIIHCVEILRKIFKQDMFMKSDSIDNHIDPLEPNVKSDSDGSIRVFDPVEFFMSMKDNPTMLNDIIQKYFG